MRISKEVKVGVLAIVSITILYFGFNYLKGIDFRHSTNRYFLVFDKVGELQESNPVKIEGVPVGRVGGLTLIQKKKNEIIVAIDVNSDVKISKGAIGELKSVFMGDTYIGLNIEENTPPFYQDGDTISSYFDEGLAVIMDEATMMLDTLKNTISIVDSTLLAFKETSLQINSLLVANKGDLRHTVRKFKSSSDSLELLLGDARIFLAKYGELADSLKSIEFNETLSKAQAMMVSITENMEAIKNQEGTMGKLMYNDSLYNNLNSAMAHLDSLFIDLKENPSRYVQVSVFGKKDKTKKNKN